VIGELNEIKKSHPKTRVSFEKFYHFIVENSWLSIVDVLRTFAASGGTFYLPIPCGKARGKGGLKSTVARVVLVAIMGAA